MSENRKILKVMHKKLGSLCVDSATFMITDPCYIKIGLTETDVTEALTSENIKPMQVHHEIKKSKRAKKSKIPDCCLLMRTPFGDGMYEIIGDVSERGDLLGIYIDFFGNYPFLYCAEDEDIKDYDIVYVDSFDKEGQ